MTDPLSLLRDFNRQSKPIEEKEGKYVIFDEFTYFKTAKTNFRIQGSRNTKTETWEYYTLETLLHFLKNTDLFHPDYCKKALDENVRPVRRPDRKQLLTYLRGTDDNTIPKSIDNLAPLESTCDIIKRAAEENLEEASLAKKVRVEDTTTQQDLKDELSAKLVESQGKNLISTNLKEDLLSTKSRTEES